MYQAEIDIEEVRNNGFPVEHEDNLVAYYYPDKFDVYNCFVPKKIPFDRAQTIFNTVASNVTFLNPQTPIPELFSYMTLLSERYIQENEGLKISLDYIKWFILKTRSGEITPYPEEKSYYWIGKYRGAPKEFKLAITRAYNGLIKRGLTSMSVQSAIDSIIEQGDYFITIKLVAKETGMHINTVRRALSEGNFRAEIDSYNEKKFKTTIYSTHKRNISIDRVVQAIDSFIDAEKFSKSKVATRSGLHRHTVDNLWNEPPVVSAYDRYNQWIRAF